MDLSVRQFGDAAEAGKIEVSENTFARDFNENLIHQVAVAYMARARAGTRAQKTRAEVRGGGAKPWKQKGTGRARAGSSRSPIWRSGGVTFAASPQSYDQKINKKMYRSAIRSIFSELVRQERLVAVSDFQLESHKTKDLLAKLNAMDLKDVYIVTDSVDEKLYLASRNLHNVSVTDVVGVSPVNLIGYDKVIVTEGAIKRLEEWLA